MQLINRLSERDVKMLAVDRNIPEALRLIARKLMVKSLK
jgi:ABC-type lipopolysaccharide export system ATPase subunit